METNYTWVDRWVLFALLGNIVGNTIVKIIEVCYG